MTDLNDVKLTGNLVRDPELRYTPKGTAVCNLSVAVNRQWKSESGEKQEEAAFVEVTAWGKTGETIAQYFKKGSKILLAGRLKQETWDDKDTGKKRSKIVVVAEQFWFQGKSEKADGAPTAQETPAGRRRTTSATASTDPNPKSPIEDSDIPF